MKYRGHVIEKESGDGIYLRLSGVSGYRISGPHCSGGSPTLAGAKNLVDAAIKRGTGKSSILDTQKGEMMPATARKSDHPAFVAVWSCDQVHNDPGIVFAGYESSMSEAKKKAAEHNRKYHKSQQKGK